MSTNAYIDRMNWANDRRNCERAKATTITIWTEDPETGEQIEDTIELPWRWEVCPVCDGKGTHVNPAIDCGGLTGEDFADDPDFCHDYFAGAYDQPCNHCGGRTTVPVPDEMRMTPEQLQAYEQHLRDEAEYAAERRAEYIHGC